MNSVPSKAEAIAHAAKAVYTELKKEFDEDTAKDLLIASMPTITEDVVKPTAIRYFDGGLTDGMVLWGDTEPEITIPLNKKHEGKEPRWFNAWKMHSRKQ
ncbi:hypothetical protein [Paenibacillus sp. Marseille-Q4541]|uniref:hypothetical protein n=1 Tax=Paenibacillus sp. Marseille-Q4541 TaxID=2831522 RepID=UPI001BAA45F1|nr:hypothetical protein [Paenibacillus sp. Marseille-Q4541]